jgi:hypothetical protein
MIHSLGTESDVLYRHAGNDQQLSLSKLVN